MSVKSKFMSTILYLELDLRTGLKKKKKVETQQTMKARRTLS